MRIHESIIDSLIAKKVITEGKDDGAIKGNQKLAIKDLKVSVKKNKNGSKSFWVGYKNEDYNGKYVDFGMSIATYEQIGKEFVITPRYDVFGRSDTITVADEKAVKEECKKLLSEMLKDRYKGEVENFVNWNSR